MTTDQEWARELFERSRQAEEPVWVADHAAMMRSGQRRSRIRTLTTSGSVVATAAVVAAVGIGVAGGADGKSPGPAPGHGVPPATKTSSVVDPSRVLDYAAFVGFSTKDAKGGAGFFKKYYIAVSDTTARDTMQVLSSLDPTLTHIAKASPPAKDTRLVSDDDPIAQDMSDLDAVAVWTDSGMSAASLQTSQATAPVGTLSLTFVDSNMEGPGGQATCTADEAVSTGMLNPVQTSSHSWRDTAQWSPCTTSALPDGSVLQTSTKSYGSFFLAFATRKFPGNGGEMALTWANYTNTVTAPPTTPGMTPNPKRVLSPNPIAVEKLAAALSDSRLLPAIPSGATTPR